jgi:hypothetical protein
MSKERELLKRFMTELKTEEDVVSLFNDIKECLAQPEQTEQEPVAWITEWVQRYRHNDTPIIDRAVSFTKGDAPAVPNPNYIPLYTAPPKRESLTPRQGLEEYKKGYARAEIDLKREPLSETAVCEILIKKEWRGFVDLVRIIEKAHGIGGEE